MAPLFSSRANTRVRTGLIIAGLVALAVPVFGMLWVRTPMVTGESSAPVQPIPFSHPIHVTGLNIDCRYCHYTVEREAPAGMPATSTCVPCHSDAWLQSSMFTPVRRSLATGRPIPWQRVNRLPDYTYFHHGIHVSKGIGCETCHGRVDRMETVQQAEPLTMEWCLECHMEPEQYLRPVEEVTTMGWEPHVPQPALGRRLAEQYGVREITNCTACHR